MVVVLMGVSGAGKTAVGERLAARLDWPFVDADDLHPAGNIRKMMAGTPLTDADRAPWLTRVRAAIGEHARAGRSVVVACSALKRSYRDALREGPGRARFVYLRVSPGVLARRLGERRDHFFEPSLLASQLDALEEPSDALVIDADAELDDVVEAVLSGLELAAG